MTGYSNPFGAAASAAQSDAATPGHIKDTTTAHFQGDVMEESLKQPVLVDFWAPWCGPCRQLTPVLEKVVNEGEGRVKLVKLNIDDHPSIPGQMGIQSIPAVIAFVNGRPVDGFMGALPESQVRAFIDKIAGGVGDGPDDQAQELEAILNDAEAALTAGDLTGAAQLYGGVLQAEPENLKALAGMANCMITVGQWERARDLITGLDEEKKEDPIIAILSARIAQIEEARKLGDPQALEHELSLHPDNHDSRLKLAKILNVEGDREGAAEHLLYIMKKDRSFDDDGARRQLLQFFEVWGPKDPATINARRKLSSILFS